MKLLTILFSLFILAIIVLADLGSLPPMLNALYDFPLGDKFGHFILFGLLNFLITLTILKSRPEREPLKLSLAVGSILTLLITLEEFSQKFFSKRSYDLVDLLASCLGTILGGWVALKIRKKEAVT